MGLRPTHRDESALLTHRLIPNGLCSDFRRSENPQSLASILLALISALGGQRSTLPAEEREEEGAFVLT